MPKEYTDTLAIFDFPKKNVADVVSFFSVQGLSKIHPIISDKKESSNNDKEFQAYFKKIKPYILAYRVKDLEDKEEGAKKLKNITIKLYQNITCQIDDKEYVLSDYDYLIDGECYLIKTPNLELKNIRQEYDFYTVFGDILGLVFGLENTDKFKYCIKDSEINIKRDIKEHISNHAINDARASLGIAGDFYNFWHKVYELLGKEYTDDDGRHQFKKNLYQHCIDNSQQKEFLAKLKQCKTPSTSCYAETLEVDYQKEYKEFIQQTFGFEIKKIKSANFDEIFNKNKQKLGDDFECVENDDIVRSLLYFKDGVEKIKKNITQRKKKEQQNSKPTQINTNTIKEIKPAELAVPSSNQKSSNPVFGTQSYSQQNKQGRSAGYDSEKIVYDSLVDKYDKENVNWISIEQPNDDHDFEYKDRANKWWFVEVKTLSNGMFYISKNERECSEYNKEKYKIFLVGEKIEVIYPVDFNDKKRFILEAEKMSVHYKLE